MRITNAQFYQNSKTNNQNSMGEIYKINQQISSGIKIQNSFEDSSVFTDTMRLDYKIASLDQVKERSSKAQIFANNTDTAFNQFTDTLTQFKTKMIQAANQINSTTSLNALANDLEGLKTNLATLSNTSINGQFLFSGSALSTKPINSDGTYNGNSDKLKAGIGDGVEIPYNIDGTYLFEGKDSDYKRTVSTNNIFYNQSQFHPNIMTSNGGQTPSKEVYLGANDSIRDMVGDSDSNTSNDPGVVFYLSGRKADGITFNSKIQMTSNEKVSALIERIGQSFGNTPTNNVANVSLNPQGQIQVQDLTTGNNLLEMNIFGAVDRTATTGFGNADVSDINTLMNNNNIQIVDFQKSNFKSTNSVSQISSTQDIYTPGQFTLGSVMKNQDGTPVNTSTTLQSFMGTNVSQIALSGKDNTGSSASSTLALNTVPATTVQNLLSSIQTTFGLTSLPRLENGQIYINEGDTTNFSANQLAITLKAQDGSSANTNAFSTYDSMNYTMRGFESNGNKLTSNVSQVIKSTNAYAIASTKLSEVSGRVPLNGTTLDFNFSDVTGAMSKGTVTLLDSGSTFSIDFNKNGSYDTGETISLFDPSGGATKADNVTYQQLSDVISLALSNKQPTTTSSADYAIAISTAKTNVDVYLDKNGKFTAVDMQNTNAKMQLSLFDSKASSFPTTPTATDSSAFSFMANDAVKIDDTQINFFANLNSMIASVKNGEYTLDANNGDPRRMGINNGINQIGHLLDHVTKAQTTIGSYSNALSSASERAQLLSVNVQTIRSDVISVDIAGAYLKFNQISNSYQAMLSTAAKINSMSLLKYM